MPRIIYKNMAGERLKSVSTIIRQNLGWGKDGLVYAANKVGLEGQTLDEAWYGSRGIGDAAHLWVEADSKGEPFDLEQLTQLNEDQKTAVRRCYQSWEDFKSMVSMEVIASELSLISEIHQYGGTMDLGIVFRGRGEMSLADIKTSKRTFPENLIQLRAYGELWDENHPDQRITSYHIIRLGKEDASFHHHHYPAGSAKMIDAWSVFLNLIGMERRRKSMENP